jgi:predicted RND superfamily exporter protein
VIDGEIKFVKIESVSTMLTLQPVDDKKEVRVVVDAMIEDIDASSAATTGKLITEAGIEWTWMETEQGLVDGLFNGFAICFPVAFFVLLFATFNTIVSLFAIISIIFIVASVLGVVQMNGYDLGVAESIAGIIVIGFSVDYVVHLAHMYMEALEFDKTTRKDR